jgi:hypothetical protein
MLAGMRIAAFSIAVGASLLMATPGPAIAAKDPVYTSLFSNLAVSGYDPVAYFTMGRPVEGDPAHEFTWNGARWRFTSPEHLAMFEAEPERYAPHYGGYCAWAVSQGYTASADPEAWRIVNGQLYLNYDLEVQKTWEQDIQGNIAKAEGHWPSVLEK